MKSSKYKSLVKPSIVKAIVKDDYHLRKTGREDSEKCHEANTGDIVFIVQDRTYQWYQIRLGSELVGWIPREYLWIPPDEPTNLNKLTIEEIEGYIEYK